MACFGALFTNAFCVYVLLSLTMINTVVLLILRPYSQHFHNFGIVFNQIVVLSGEGTALLRAILSPSLSEEKDSAFQIMVYVVIALAIASLIISVIRLFVWRFYYEENRKRLRVEKLLSYDYEFDSFIKSRKFNKKAEPPKRTNVREEEIA